MTRPAPEPREPHVVVGIGASAGGLEPAKRVLSQFQKGDGVAFLVVQPLHTRGESVLPEIFGRVTSLDVVEARDGARLARDTVYTAPPESHLAVEDGRLRVVAPERHRGLRWPIDHLLRSLGREYGRRAIGLVLSGAGTDGTSGLRELKARGGLALAQDPETATHPGMLESASDAGAVDLLVDIAAVRDVIVRYVEEGRAEQRAFEARGGFRDRDVEELAELLSTHGHLDLSHYKPGTLRRRLFRRLTLLDLDAATYLRRLREDEDELEQLVRDLLIGVTDFFRDPLVFEAVRDVALAEALSRLAPGEALRLWCAGCSTGEEAYTLAMLAEEAAERSGKGVDIHVFATDVDVEALGVARAGVYGATVEKRVSRERRERFFERMDDGAWRVKSHLRDRVSFALHDLCNDPPFSRMHVVSCRNVLIYLRRPIQERVLSLFHFALLPDGFLVLGTSESVTPAKELFSPSSSLAPLYRRVGFVRRALPVPKSLRPLRSSFDALVGAGGETPSGREDISLEARTHERLQAAHEESLSMAEELQSANEELEATMEELRSLNEELSAVNAQLKEKVQALEHAHDDLANFFSSTRIATLILDEELQIRRFTPAAATLLGLSHADVHREVAAFDSPLLGSGLAEEGALVLSDLVTRTREIQGDQRWYLRRSLPYRTSGDRIAGVVVSFVDVTDVKRAQEDLAVRRRQSAALAQLGLVALAGDDLDALLGRAVEQVASVLEVPFAGVLGLRADGGALELRASHGLSGARAASVSSSPAFDAGFTLNANGAVEVVDFGEEARFSPSPLLVEHRVASGLSCALRDGGGPWGVLGVWCAEPRRFDAEEQNFLTSVANVLSSALTRRRVERRLAEESRRLDLALSEGGIGTWERNFRSGALVFDERQAALFGLTPSEVTLENVRARIHPADVEHVLQSWQRAFEGGEDVDIELRVVWPSGEVRWMASKAGVATGDDGAPDRLVGVGFDITAQKRAEERLREADRHKNEFLAMLGHELRNPLAAIRYAAELLRRAEVGQEPLLRARDVIDRQASHMSRILDGLLDVSRVARGKVALHRALVDLEGVVRVVVDDATPKANGVGVRLLLDGRGPLLVLGDATRLSQVVDNLLSNAIKFTPPGGTVRVELTAIGDRACVRVIDTGAGLAPEMLEAIFEPFRQARQELDRKEGGLGLGLSLVRGLVELHDGEVEARSAGLGQGATFEVRLPLHRGPGPAEEAGPSSRPAARRRVLVVDDNQDGAEVLGDALRAAGHEVHVAYDGRHALALLEELVPDVILCDLGLPDGLSGYDLARAFRADARLAGTLLVALSGYGQDDDKSRALAAGFDAHLTKPAAVDVIEAAIAGTPARDKLGSA